MISIVTPAYNEAANLPPLYERICTTMEALGHDWEWIVVDAVSYTHLTLPTKA